LSPDDPDKLKIKNIEDIDNYIDKTISTLSKTSLHSPRSSNIKNEKLDYTIKSPRSDTTVDEISSLKKQVQLV